MGATFFYDAMHEVPKPERREGKRPERQLEVFTHGGMLYLRVGPLGEENAGDTRTVRLDAAQVTKLTDGLERALSYLGGAR